MCDPALQKCSPTLQKCNPAPQKWNPVLQKCNPALDQCADNHTIIIFDSRHQNEKLIKNENKYP